jgi:acetyl/propionyl-CoA carboxylase alpha subunit
LQVEHPVTEMVTGLDLVELQLRVAAGEPLSLRQEDVRFSGHAVEFRINAEDPWDGFKPSSGRITHVWDKWGRRNDLGVAVGDTVPTVYDSLLGKEILQGSTRDSILSEIDDEGGLCEIRFERGRSNRELLMAIIASHSFRSGSVDTQWLEGHLDYLLETRRASEEQFVAAAAVGFISQKQPEGSVRTQGRRSPFTAGKWLGAGASCVFLDDGTRTASVDLSMKSAVDGIATFDGADVQFRVVGDVVQVGPHHTPYAVRLMVSGISVSRVDVPAEQTAAWFTLVPPPPLPRRAHTAAEGATAITAPLAGTIAAVRVAEGEAVEAGQLLLVLEAMKMEHRITAPASGTVKAVPVRERDVVREGDVLVELA